MKEKILSITFVVIMCLFMCISIISPDKKVSVSERRNLISFPVIQLDSIINGDFFENLDKYLVEQFPFRDLFRNIKGIVSNKIFQKFDEDGIFIKNNVIYQIEPNLDLKSVKHLTSLINKINDTYISSDNIYYSIIPDKNYYLNDNSIPKLNYKQLENTLNKELINIKYINIFNELDLESYYNTDIHWRQEKLEKVTKKIQSSMNLSQNENLYTTKEYNKFYGALYSRVANNLKPDRITYLTNDEINNAKVYDYEKKEYRNVYEEKNLKNIDSYDIYLGGAKPLLIIENKNQTSGRELILFIDSFVSSIAPLLISNYSKITLIDLRYIKSDLLNDIEEINFDNKKQDVLFLYSTNVINSSFTLK